MVIYSTKFDKETLRIYIPRNAVSIKQTFIHVISSKYIYIYIFLNSVVDIARSKAKFFGTMIHDKQKLEQRAGLYPYIRVYTEVARPVYTRFSPRQSRIYSSYLLAGKSSHSLKFPCDELGTFSSPSFYPVLARVPRCIGLEYFQGTIDREKERRRRHARQLYGSFLC